MIYIDINMIISLHKFFTQCIIKHNVIWIDQTAKKLIIPKHSKHKLQRLRAHRDVEMFDVSMRSTVGR